MPPTWRRESLSAAPADIYQVHGAAAGRRQGRLRGGAQRRLRQRQVWRAPQHQYLWACAVVLGLISMRP